MALVRAMRFEGLGLKTVMQLEGLITPFSIGIAASGSKPSADADTFMRGNNEPEVCPDAQR
jgi:formylmethanofuran:tetrahydromethanopterin formyltransferase